MSPDLFPRLPEDYPNATIVSFGAGVDSTAMLVEMVRLQWRPDLILFADTGAERPDTYRHRDTFSAWLQERGFPGVVTVRYVPPIAPYTTLEGNCLHNETLPSLAFGMKSCSVKWKVKPQETYLDAWMQERGFANRRRLHLIGLDGSPADLKRRATYAAGNPNSPRCVYRYPLQEWGWDRERCKAEIRRAGVPVPEKSCCFFCPAMKKDEIREQATRYPDLHRRAVALEHRAMTGKHDMKTTKGLGRRFAWSELPMIAT